MNVKTLALLLLSAACAQAANPVVIAHRGASGYLPEHTLPAKAYAHALGADYLEQDLVLTKDDVPVVLHDIYLDTVTDVATRFPEKHRADGRYYALDLTLAELKQLRATERFNAKSGEAVFARRFPVRQSAFVVSTLEEELQFIQGLNRSTGRSVGIYPEIKQPKWHRDQGHDISRLVLPILEKYGYRTKADGCFVQCFELAEVRRIRNELGWKGRLVLLLNGRGRADDVSDDSLATAEGLQGLAATVDGIGPPLNRLITWQDSAARDTGLARSAHAAGLVVHAYTLRTDELPKGCPSADALHAALFRQAGIDGLFSDFTDVTVKWLTSASLRP